MMKDWEKIKKGWQWKKYPYTIITIDDLKIWTTSKTLYAVNFRNKSNHHIEMQQIEKTKQQALQFAKSYMREH